jgi:hypothetical protein
MLCCGFILKGLGPVANKNAFGGSYLCYVIGIKMLCEEVLLTYVIGIIN